MDDKDLIERSRWLREHSRQLRLCRQVLAARDHARRLQEKSGALKTQYERLCEEHREQRARFQSTLDRTVQIRLRRLFPLMSFQSLPREMLHLLRQEEGSCSDGADQLSPDAR